MEKGSFCNLSFIFYFLLVLGCFQEKKNIISHGRVLQSKTIIETNKLLDPSLNVFFTPNDLKLGEKMPIFFPIKNISQIPKLLPKEMAEKIPFSLKNLTYLLQFFSISKHSPQAKAMEYTLTQCELKPMQGETKFCATSLESLYVSTRRFFGSIPKAEATVYPKKFETELQNYTILEEPIKILSEKILSCHRMAYPYLVLYCHSQMSDKVLYKVVLEGENGDIVESLGICHVDTSEWDKDHVVFRVLNVEPGGSSICHFYPKDNIVFVSNV